MFSHITIGSNDLARTKAFYDAPFAATGGEPGFEDAKRRLIYARRGGRPIVTKPVDGKPATGANGGTSVEDPPGERTGSAGRMHLAYLRDPDGNKFCAFYRLPD